MLTRKFCIFSIMYCILTGCTDSKDSYEWRGRIQKKYESMNNQI